MSDIVAGGICNYDYSSGYSYGRISGDIASRLRTVDYVCGYR